MNTNEKNHHVVLNKIVDFLLIKAENPETQSANRLFLKLSMYLSTALGAAKGMLDVSHNTPELTSLITTLSIPILIGAASSLAGTYWNHALTIFLDKKDKAKFELLSHDQKVLEKIIPLLKEMVNEKSIKLESTFSDDLDDKEKKELGEKFFEPFKNLALELKDPSNIANMNKTMHQVFSGLVEKKEIENFDLHTLIKKKNLKV